MTLPVADAPTVTPEEIARTPYRLRRDSIGGGPAHYIAIVDAQGCEIAAVQIDPPTLAQAEATAEFIVRSCNALASPSPHTEEPAQQPKATHEYEACGGPTPCVTIPGCHALVTVIGGRREHFCCRPSSDPIHAPSTPKENP